VEEPRVFISYRRQDTSGYAGHLFESLRSQLPRGSRIFMDVDSIQGGSRFEQEIENAVGECSSFLALIGPGWSGVVDDDGNRRLDDPKDFVRREIEAAITNNVPIVPVLMNGARMPTRENVPPAIADLVERQAVEISDSHWAPDVDRLVATILGPESRRRRRRLVIAIAAALAAVLVVAGAIAVLAGGNGDDVAGAAATPKLLLADSLHDTGYGWPERSSDSCAQHRLSSGYQFAIGDENEFVYCIADTTFDLSLTQLGDVRVEAAVRTVTEGGSGPYGAGIAGLRCRAIGGAATGDAYSAAIGPTGYWQIARFNAGKQDTLRDGLYPDGAPTLDQARNLALSCLDVAGGVQLTFSIDGRRVARLVDTATDRLMTGAVGMDTSDYTNSALGTEFTDFKVYGPSDARKAKPLPTSTLQSGGDRVIP
jgi:hypothetical protein